MSTTPTVHDQTFGPEMVAIVERAFAAVCEKLGLAPDEDPLASYVARTVIGLAPGGFRESEGLAAAVMQRLEDEAVIGWNGEHFTAPAHKPQGVEHAAR